MSVNEKKSKIMIFCKKETETVRHSKFLLNGKILDKVKEFTYLGVKITSTGKFGCHLIQTREKALHAFYKITKLIELKKLKPLQAIRLFDSSIAPILTYGSEVWSLYET